MMINYWMEPGAIIFRQICAADLSDFHMGDFTRHEQYARGNKAIENPPFIDDLPS